MTIKDISEALQISKTTISMVINGQGERYRISKPVREKILRFVSENSYTPSANARSMRTRVNYIISLILDDIKDPFLSELAFHIEQAAYEKKYKVIYHCTNNEQEKLKETIHRFGDHHCDGYILVLNMGHTVDLKQLPDEDLPCVLFDRGGQFIHSVTGMPHALVRASGNPEKDAVKVLGNLLQSIERSREGTLYSPGKPLEID